MSLFLVICKIRLDCNGHVVMEIDITKHVEYIHFNPVKHGLVKSPVEWPYSSFHRYVKQGAYDSDWGAGTEIKFDVKVGHE